MAHLLRVNDSQATPVQATTMGAEDLEEVQHLEQWIVQHPEVIDDSLMIVATQFNRWASSAGGSAREALDVLGLSSSGQSVVIELKRSADRKVHLQAITYAALVAGFDRFMLAEAHAQWMTKRGHEMTSADALELLTEHLESGWDDDILKLPRLVLVAEEFPDQVLTTVQWLTGTVAGGLEIECHEYSMFRDLHGVLASFERRFPVEDIEGRTLRPVTSVDAHEVRDRIATRERRARSVKVIADHQGIPEGASIDFDARTLVRPEAVDQADQWLDEDPERREVTWVNHPSHPLRWHAAEDPDRPWSPTSLRNEIFEQAGLPRPTFSAADAWTFQGRNLYTIAEDVLRDLEDTGADE